MNSLVDNLWTTRPKSARLIHNVSMYLTKQVRSTLAGEPLRRIARRRSLVLLGLLCVVGTTPAQGSTNIDQYKLYTHSRIIDYKQFICLSNIFNKESRWNPYAVNGSHYGLGQMKSKHYRNLDPYRQIDATILYVKGRYGSMCKAWEFHKVKGYY